MMQSIINYHVIDPNNVGDLLSAPSRYFNFPRQTIEPMDIRQIKAEDTAHKHIIVGGGGLLFSRFQEQFKQLVETPDRGKIIAWGVGQQTYDNPDLQQLRSFDYASYLAQFDLVGIRDIDCGYNWVPCASCLHPAFDRKREIKHEFVVFSHRKFQLKINNFPSLTHETTEFEEVLDFLGSGETILTSSYHGAYWGLLLGRKVLAFPFSSKFYTFKHRPGIYPTQKWRQEQRNFSVFNKVLAKYRYKDQFSCDVTGWQDYAKKSQAYPECLQESRDRNHTFYQQVMQLISD